MLVDLVVIAALGKFLKKYQKKISENKNSKFLHFSSFVPEKMDSVEVGLQIAQTVGLVPAGRENVWNIGKIILKIWNFKSKTYIKIYN